MYFLGIDCGTQGTKAIIFDSETGKVISKGYCKHQIIADDAGNREQETFWWTDAMISSIKVAIHKAGIDGKLIKAIAISGQQHGLVILDKNKNVLRKVKLWNDTSTVSDNEEIINMLGGSDKVWDIIHTTLPVGYTASKVRYLVNREPKLWEKVSHVILPHDYLNYFLTGNLVTESSEASGTGYYDVASRKYSSIMLSTIDPSGILASSLPKIISWKDSVGTLRPELAKELGMNPSTLVAAGGGDNTMSAIGTGTIIEGNCSLSLGTSGTVTLNSPTISRSMDKLIQIYAIMDNRWLATTCTLNATSASSSVQEVFDVPLKDFDNFIANAPVGSNGVKVIQFFGGERMPPIPRAKGSITGLTTNSFTRSNIIRATAESVIYTLRWGYDKLIETFPKPEKLIINGGGSNSAPWRQITADVFNLPVLNLECDEGGALGAALQAMSLYEQSSSLSELCKRYITIDHSKDCLPVIQNVEKYKVYYKAFKEEIKRLWDYTL